MTWSAQDVSALADIITAAGALATVAIAAFAYRRWQEEKRAEHDIPIARAARSAANVYFHAAFLYLREHRDPRSEEALDTAQHSWIEAEQEVASALNGPVLLRFKDLCNAFQERAEAVQKDLDEAGRMAAFLAFLEAHEALDEFLANPFDWASSRQSDQESRESRREYFRRVAAEPPPAASDQGTVAAGTPPGGSTSPRTMRDRARLSELWTGSKQQDSEQAPVRSDGAGRPDD